MLVLLALQLVAAGNTPNLCSNELTAQGSSQYLTFNSYGSCTENCQGYAYAIAQGNECWCSNEAPGDTVSTSDCDESCPGFPDDICGGSGGLYGYYQIGQPSGTASSSDTSSTQSSSSSSDSSSTSISTSSTTSSRTTSSQSSSSTTSSTSTSSSSSSSSSSTTSESDSSSDSSALSGSSETSTDPSTTAEPTVSYITITQSNSVQTQTITQRASSTTEAQAEAAGTQTRTTSAAATTSEGSGFFHNKGAVAGVFVVVGLVVLALALLALFLCVRRRRNQRITTAVSSSHHDMRSGRDSFAQLENDSQLVPIFDQRVDAQQMYMRWENNTSQQSLQDNQDYSRRVLRVANPDGN